VGEVSIRFGVVVLWLVKFGASRAYSNGNNLFTDIIVIPCRYFANDAAVGLPFLILVCCRDEWLWDYVMHSIPQVHFCMLK
jgi:hypothetical protein